MLTVAGAPLRVARVTMEGIEIPLTSGAREQLASAAPGGLLHAELTLVGDHWEASYVLDFEIEVHEAGRAWLAFSEVDDALALALDRFGATAAPAAHDARRLVLPESRRVRDITEARRSGTYAVPAPPAAAPRVSLAEHPALFYVALTASLILAALAAVYAFVPGA